METEGKWMDGSVTQRGTLSDGSSLAASDWQVELPGARVNCSTTPDVCTSHVTWQQAQ
jgi:hypothetical protein